MNSLSISLEAVGEEGVAGKVQQPLVLLVISQLHQVPQVHRSCFQIHINASRNIKSAIAGSCTISSGLLLLSLLLLVFLVKFRSRRKDPELLIRRMEIPDQASKL